MKILPYRCPVVRNLGKTIMPGLAALFVLAVALPGGPSGPVDPAKLPPPADQKGLTYENDIRPIFEQSCLKCHGPEKQKGKLRLDSLAAALKGGEVGKVIEKGNSAKSVLVHFVARLNEDDAMPPKNGGKPLTKDQVGLIRAWIDQGAK